MKQATSIYIKKLIGLSLVLLASLYVFEFVEIYALIPLSLLVHSFIYFRITGKKPPYLFGLKKVDDFITKKGGFWNLFKLVLILIGFVYDIAIWVAWSVYIIFEIALDVIVLVKEIIYWIIHALIWFLKLFVPPIVFLYKMFLHYIVNWIWWLYRVSFRHVASCVKLNYFLVSLWGGVLATFAVLLFYYISILFGEEGLIFIGIVLATLPLAWTFGEISSINENNLEKEPYYEVSSNFENGFEAVKYVLYYVVTFLVLFIAAILLNMLGWIPDVGLTLLGFTIPITTLISLILIFLFFITLFATVIIPTHLLKTEEQETPFHDVVSFFSVILKKGVQYVLVTIPSIFFGSILSIIPVFLVIGAISLTFFVKDDVIERRISTLELKKAEQTEFIEKYKIDAKINKLDSYIVFPENIIDNNKNLKGFTARIQALSRKIEDQRADNATLQADYFAKEKTFKANLTEAERITNPAERAREIEILNIEHNRIKKNYKEEYNKGILQVKKYEVDRKNIKNTRKQSPFAFFFIIIWASIFIGLAMAVFLAYLGNVYHELYSYKKEGATYFSEIVKETKKADRKQPLLGFTLLGILVIVFIFVYQYFNG